MASKIKGITIEISGNAKLPVKTSGDVNKTSRNLQSELIDEENEEKQSIKTFIFFEYSLKLFLKSLFFIEITI